MQVSKGDVRAVDNLGDVAREVQGWAGLGAAGMLGRLIYHSRQVQRGRRKFFSPALLLEAPIALGMGFIAHGVCVWAGVNGDAETAAVVLASYLGPHAIDTLFIRWMDRKLGPTKAS